MSDKHNTKRVLMAKNVARSWLDRHSSSEYRLYVYPPLGGKNNLPSWLRAFRDGRTKFGSVEPFDFGVAQGNDSFCIRSRDIDGLIALDQTLCDMGYDTSGIW